MSRDTIKYIAMLTMLSTTLPMCFYPPGCGIPICAFTLAILPP